MNKKLLLLGFIFMFPLLTRGIIHVSIADGDFQDPTHWSTGVVPQMDNPNDTVIVYHDMFIPLSGQYRLRGFLYVHYGASLYTPNQFRIDGGHAVVWGYIDVHNNLWLENNGLLQIYYSGYAFVDNKVTQSGGEVELIGGTICWHNLWKGPPPLGVGVTLHKDCYLSTGPLGIELVSFKAECNMDAVELTWMTENEENNDHFTIERSRDLITWEKVAVVPGILHALGPVTYHYSVHPPGDGIHYYRLSQTDTDGTLTVYGDQWLREADCNSSNSLTAFPNPSSCECTILGLTRETTAELFNMTGRKVKTYHLGPEHPTFSFPDLDPGVYFLVTCSGQAVKIVKN